MFLTCFSYFSRYFQYFRKIATYQFLSVSTSYMRPHVSGTERKGFSFLLTKILELTLSCISQAMQYSPSRNHLGYPTREKMLIVTCHMTAFLLMLRSKAIVRSSSLRILRSGIFNLRRVVLLRYCSHCVRQSVSRTSFAHGFLVD